MEYPVLNSSFRSCIDSQFVCSTNFMMKTDENSYFKEDCKNNCPMECDHIEFDYTFSGYEVNYFQFYNFHFIIV